MSAKGITIALSGKGGVGKTFISSMLVKRLAEHAAFWLSTPIRIPTSLRRWA